MGAASLPSLIMVIGTTLAAILTIGLICYGLYFLISLPLRRQERARILIDLMELQENTDRDPAATIKELSQTQDPALGVRFHVLGAYLESGRSLAESLKCVPRLLPDSIRESLVVGEQLGSFRKILPVCQIQLRDAASTIQNVTRYLVLSLFLALPTLLTVTIFSIQVWPKMMMIADDYGVTPLPVVASFVDYLPQVLLVIAIVYALLYLLALFYIGGPRLRGWLENGIVPITHGIVLRIPWVRKRLLRNFSMMLSTLLDAGVPEAKALELAAHASANRALKRRVRRCIQSLEAGETLEQALQRLDSTPELAWRLRLAAKRSDGFKTALQGWWEWLHTKARLQEQTTAQWFSITMIFVHGLIAASLSISMFHVITSIIDQGTLW